MNTEEFKNIYEKYIITKKFIKIEDELINNCEELRSVYKLNEPYKGFVKNFNEQEQLEYELNMFENIISYPELCSLKFINDETIEVICPEKLSY
jgi:hypothetical protein